MPSSKSRADTSPCAVCQWLDIHPSGYFAWRKQPRSARSVANERLTGLIKEFRLESRDVYGYRKIYLDLQENKSVCKLPLQRDGGEFFQLLKRERIRRHVYET